MVEFVATGSVVRDSDVELCPHDVSAEAANSAAVNKMIRNLKNALVMEAFQLHTLTYPVYIRTLWLSMFEFACCRVTNQPLFVQYVIIYV